MTPKAQLMKLLKEFEGAIRADEMKGAQTLSDKMLIEAYLIETRVKLDDAIGDLFLKPKLKDIEDAHAFRMLVSQMKVGAVSTQLPLYPVPYWIGYEQCVRNAGPEAIDEAVRAHLNMTEEE